MRENSFIALVIIITAQLIHSGNTVVEPLGTKYANAKFADLPNFYEKLLRSQILSFVLGVGFLYRRQKWTSEGKIMLRKLFFAFVTSTAYFLRSGNAVIEPLETKYVITKFPNLPNFYEKLRSQNSSTTCESELTDDITVRICGLIFGNDAVIEPDIPLNMEKLKRYERSIFKELFKEEGAEPSPFKMKVFRSKRYSYDNSSKSRTFLVNEVEREEKTFACVIQKSDQTKIDIYYVSDYVYNVNDEGGHDKQRFFGRFIFLGDQIYALAEELPRNYLSNYYERIERIEKLNRFKSDAWENHPVCKLDSGKKVRLCIYVCALVSAGCEDKVAIQEPCVKTEFKWLHISYHEWMLPCIITHHTPSTLEEKFLLARTNGNHEAFAFKEQEVGGPQIRYHLIGVPVVIDELDREYAKERVQVSVPTNVQ